MHIPITFPLLYNYIYCFDIILFSKLSTKFNIYIYTYTYIQLNLIDLQNIPSTYITKQTNKKLMNILNRQQVLQKQLKLLNTPGPSLSTYYSFDIEHNLFAQPSQSIIYKLLQQYKLINVKAVPLDVNNIFYVIAYVLFNGKVLGEQELLHVLDKLKCTVYADDMDFGGIVGYQYQHKNKEKHKSKSKSKSKQKQKQKYLNKSCQVLSNKNMKKLLVQFLQISKYYNGNIQQLLTKYQIVSDILTLFFRTILLQFGIKDAKFYYKQLNKIEVINVIFDYFDILYHVHDNLVIFQNCNYCVLLGQDKEVYIGQRDSTGLGRNHVSLEFQEEFGEDLHNDHFGKDSIMIGAPTPFFKEISQDQLGLNKLGNTQVTIKQVDEQMNQSNSLKKLQQPLVNQNTLHSDSQVLLDAHKFKAMLDNYTTSPLSPKQTLKNTTKNKGSLKNLQKPDSQKNKNQQKLNISQIHVYNDDTKQTYSQKAIKLPTQKILQDDFISMRISSRQLKLPKKHYKLQSGVIQLKIQSSFCKKYKNTFDQGKTKRMQLKNQLNLPLRNVTKNYGKIPSFLVQKTTHGNKSAVSPNSPINLSPLHSNTTRIQLKDKKPRVNFTYNPNTNNYKKPTNLSINQTPIRPTSGSSQNSENYLDHDHTNNNLNISPPVSYRNSNIVRPTVIPKYQQYYHY